MQRDAIVPDSHRSAEGLRSQAGRDIARINELRPRYDAARLRILQLNPAEIVPEFGPMPAENDLVGLMLLADSEPFISELEARAEALEQESLDKLPETQKLRAEVNELKGLMRAALARISVLEGRSSSTHAYDQPRQAQSRADAPPILAPSGGAPGLGGVSAAFGEPSSASGGGVRRLGSRG
ncbi:hypothetical protein UB31_09675 [Bradyrhizobium sp. LTSP849]|uniref:hypothetical protein n=1 Tax=Bradyrhizobium sp. LTSP849 TaxID=1615890 RepID=UPI0005D249E6|nr:hypothetical protein [Bradyrhizobium sp. LTSP849]KJC52549.1 hypothetical protein UB31_09675 [Bradyrhizobium sp. LTSP849]